MQQLCLLQLSKNVWRRRGVAKHNGLRYNEETVTETLLLDLMINYPGDVRIIPFNKKNEARNGADWAWAFVSCNGHSNQGMLVQAKRLGDNDSNYHSLYYKSRSKAAPPPLSQLNQLIKSAKHYQLPPVFAFYNHLDDDSRIPHVPCGCCGYLSHCSPDSWGITLASASDVLLAKPNNQFDHHSCHSLPMHCLLCSKESRKADTMGSAAAVASTLSRMFDDDDANEDVLGPKLMPPFEPSAVLPDIFRDADMLHQSRLRNDEVMFKEIRSEYPGLAGVIIFRDNEETERALSPLSDNP